MDDEGEGLAGEVAIGAEKARLEMLAPGDAEFQRIGLRPRRGQGARAAAQATLAARGEAVTIGAIGQKPRDLDMDAVRELGARERCALGNDVATAAVARHPHVGRASGRDTVCTYE